jgi:hypothetical protein
MLTSPFEITRIEAAPIVVEDEPPVREFSEQDWQRLWRRFLSCAESGRLSGRIAGRELARLRSAPPERRGELVRMFAGRLSDWRFASFFEALACEVEDLFRPRPAKTATYARPGSVEKIAVLAARAERGEELYHPDDETIPLCSPVLE